MPTPPSNSVFIHSGFRASSTWLWLKFRENRRFRAYYEIFNEALSHLSLEAAVAIGPETWRSRHPDSAPYFLEFSHRIDASGGVAGFPADPGSGFFPGPDLSADEQSYVSGLIDDALRVDRIPVLTCTRTLGRASALKNAFGGFHIVLHRNLFEQWNSFSGQHRSGDPAFVVGFLKTLNQATNDPFSLSLAARIPCEDSALLAYAEGHYDDVFAYFVAWHVYVLTLARRHADLDIDVSRLGDGDSDYRRSVEAALKEGTGETIDLSGAVRRIDAPWTPVHDIAAARLTAEILTDSACRLIDADAEELGFARAMLAAAWQEQDRFTHYAEPYVDVLNDAAKLRNERDLVRLSGLARPALQLASAGNATEQDAVSDEPSLIQRLEAHRDYLLDRLASTEASATERVAHANENLSKGLMNVSAAQSALDNETRRTSELSELVLSLSQEVADLSEICTSRNAEVESLAKALAEAESSEKSALADALTAHADQKSALDEASQERDAMRVSIHAMAGELADLEHSHRAELSRLAAELADSEMKRSSLEAELEASMNSVVTLTDRNNYLEQQISTLRETHGIESKRAFSEVRKEKEAALRDSVAMSATLEGLRRERDAQSLEIDSYRNSSREMLNLVGSVSALLEQPLATAELDGGRFATAIAGVAAELKASASLISSLREQHDRRLAECEEQKLRIHTLSAMVKRLGKESGMLKSELSASRDSSLSKLQGEQAINALLQERLDALEVESRAHALSREATAEALESERQRFRRTPLGRLLGRHQGF